MAGDVDQNAVADGSVFKTLGGKEVTFSRIGGGGKLLANGIELIEGGTPVPHGALLFLKELLFVDDASVTRLNEEHAYLESGPLLPLPWDESQFLSHAFNAVSENEQHSYMAEYMNMTPELGRFAPRFRKW